MEWTCAGGKRGPCAAVARSALGPDLVEYTRDNRVKVSSKWEVIIALVNQQKQAPLGATLQKKIQNKTKKVVTC